MPVPDYQKLFLPILRYASDGQEHSYAQAVEAVVKHFNLTEDDCNELLPSGTQRKLGNRASWSRFHMIKAGLLEAVGRGRFKITARGTELLNTKVSATWTASRGCQLACWVERVSFHWSGSQVES
jgi:restriction system protein